MDTLEDYRVAKSHTNYLSLRSFRVLPDVQYIGLLRPHYLAVFRMGQIRILPDTIANKIAGGEIVERPASVIKELLENALDAGSTRLHIELKSAGKQLIRVSDNGTGMGRDDAMLAFERHATSKLRDARDLLSITTLGFRGEALPAIASVSQLIMETRSPNENTGTRVEIAGGKILTVEEAALPSGTTISVRNLFYNTPARRKFMRSEKTELSHISSVAMHYSLAHLDKFFSLTNERGQLLNASPVQSLKERVYQVFGADTLSKLVELPQRQRSLGVVVPSEPATQTTGGAGQQRVSNQHRELKVSGFISTPQVQKLNRNSLYIFVNKRLIRDRLLLRAILRAYHNLIPAGNFPFVLLFLEMPFDEVDVNVHPAKTEVRFRHPGFVHDFLRDAIRDQLIESKPVSTFPISGTDTQPDTEPHNPLTDGYRNVESFPKHLDFTSASPIDFTIQKTTTEEWSTKVATPLPSNDSAERNTEIPERYIVEEKPHSRARLIDTPTTSMIDLGQLRSLGQIHDSFIVATGPTGLWIIDQHVAHERILFEKVLAARSQGTIESQRLLLPIVVSLKPDQEVKFSQIQEDFDAIGFEVEPFGNRTIVVKSAPAILSPQQVEQLMEEILDTPESELRELSYGDLQRRLAATIACHAAIKVNTPLDKTKIQWLLDELSKTECPMSCPHGRPVALEHNIKAILKAFHRT